MVEERENGGRKSDESQAPSRSVLLMLPIVLEKNTLSFGRRVQGRSLLMGVSLTFYLRGHFL